MKEKLRVIQFLCGVLGLILLFAFSFNGETIMSQLGWGLLLLAGLMFGLEKWVGR